MDKIEEKIRKLTIPQLQILKAVAQSDYGILDSQEIMATTNTASATFGAFITSLKKLKNEKGEPIILPAGRTLDGTRWQLNERVIEKRQLLIILNKMRI